MEEIAFITATVNRLDDEIKQLNAQRAALLRRLNELRRTVPPETLSLIFHHADSSLFLLAAVCAHWREVAWTTPTLWTDIAPVPLRHNASHSDAALLRLYFANAGALPVSLNIKLDRLSASTSAPAEEILQVAFIENSAKIKALSCTSKSALRRRWATVVPKLASSRFPHLERLEISLRYPPSHRYHTPLFHAPQLRIVSLNGYYPPNELFWPQLTTLHLSSLTIAQSLETLLRCQNLVEYRCTNPSESSTPMDFALRSHAPVTFRRLGVFHWVGSLGAWDIDLYTLVRMPNLYHMSFSNSHPLTHPLTDSLRSEFFRHIGHLSTLELGVFHTAHEWLDIFAATGPALRELRIVCSSDSDGMAFLLRELTRNYEDNSKKHQNYLPHLRVLHATFTLHSDRSKQLLDVLWSRYIRPAALTSEENDWTHNPTVDVAYWECHTRLEHAVIKCLNVGFKFTFADRFVASLLTGAGLDLCLEE